MNQTYPCCLPMNPCPAPVPPSAPLTYSRDELMAMPKCRSKWKDPNHCITVQLPPKLVNKRRIVYTKKVVQYPKIYRQETTVSVPTIKEQEKEVSIPVITWETKIVKYPKVHWHSSYVPYPQIISVPSVTVEPKEVCQAILCQPKPQIIDIPPPNKFCCYEAGPQTTQAQQPCSPMPQPPCPPYPPCRSGVMMGYGGFNGV